MARYLDPKNDLPFKKIFGEHKPLLMSFLNALLPLKKGQEIVSIEYLNPEQAPRSPLGKNSIVDVKCVDSLGRYFIVEMQMAWSQSFAKRLVFDASKAFVHQLDREKTEDKALPFVDAYPVYSLAIVNREIPKFEGEKRETWYHHYKIADIDRPNWVLEGLEFVVIELPNFKPETWSQTDKRMAVLWLRFLKEIKDSEKAAEEFLEEEAIKQAVSICEVGAYTREELAYYDEYVTGTLWESTYGELERRVAEKDEALAEKDEVIVKKDEVIAEKDEVIVKKDEVIAEKDGIIAAERKALAEKDALIAAEQAKIAKLMEHIAQLKQKS
jgi:predicted transposase/invertase (TIGR01784 family)